MYEDYIPNEGRLDAPSFPGTLKERKNVLRGTYNPPSDTLMEDQNQDHFNNPNWDIVGGLYYSRRALGAAYIIEQGLDPKPDPLTDKVEAALMNIPWLDYDLFSRCCPPRGMQNWQRRYVADAILLFNEKL